MKRGVELPYRPDAPCEIRRDLSGRKGAAGLRAVGFLSSAPLLTDMTAAPSPTDRPLRARALLQKA